MEPMTKEKLVKKNEELPKADVDLSFQLGLDKEILEILIACIRDRVDHIRE